MNNTIDITSRSKIYHYLSRWPAKHFSWCALMVLKYSRNDIDQYQLLHGLSHRYSIRFHPQPNHSHLEHNHSSNPGLSRMYRDRDLFSRGAIQRQRFPKTWALSNYLTEISGAYIVHRFILSLDVWKFQVNQIQLLCACTVQCNIKSRSPFLDTFWSFILFLRADNADTWHASAIQRTSNEVLALAAF